MNVDRIAEVAHETNKRYCETIGDFTQPSWHNAPDWQQKSAISGVEFHIANPDAGCSASHESWLKQKQEDGWKYGPVKDASIKQHPCFVACRELPEEQKVKDALFVGVVRAMKILL